MKEIKVKALNNFNKSFGIEKDNMYNAILKSENVEIEKVGYYGGIEKTIIIIESIIINGTGYDMQDFAIC